MAIPQKSLSSSQTVTLGRASDRTIASWVVQLSGTWTGSVAFRGNVAGAGLSTADRQPIPYKPTPTGTLTTGLTSVTANGIYTVVCDGVELDVDFTWGSGTMVLNATPVFG